MRHFQNCVLSYARLVELVYNVTVCGAPKPSNCHRLENIISRWIIARVYTWNNWWKGTYMAFNSLSNDITFHLNMYWNVETLFNSWYSQSQRWNIWYVTVKGPMAPDPSAPISCFFWANLPYPASYFSISCFTLKTAKHPHERHKNRKFESLSKFVSMLILKSFTPFYFMVFYIHIWEYAPPGARILESVDNFRCFKARSAENF